MSNTFTFQAETQQLLKILIHSLYSDREIFLRELISNASDALHRIQFEQLTNDAVFDADAELKIHIVTDEDAGTLTISDSGVGMTEDEMKENLGTIARSGARAFLDAMEDATDTSTMQDIIGQFGVGFYSVFMVADKVEVLSRSYLPDASAVRWESDGSSTYSIEPAEKEHRGTDIIIHLNESGKEFLNEWKIKEIIRKHSDYVAFPIFVNDDEEPSNKQVAIWRQDAKDVSDEDYNQFYNMMTMDFQPPLHRITYKADLPMQFYSLLYIPSGAEPNMFSPRKEAGLQLYARKVLIQDYTKDLLPEYLQFIQGVVDSEDLPLNVSRETVQANRIMANLKSTITRKVLTELKRLAKKDREKYLKIYEAFGAFFKQGLVINNDDREDLTELLFFRTSLDDAEKFYTLDEYVERMATGQEDVYYVIADDFTSATRSPHLDAFRQRGIEVLYFSEPVDAMLPMGLTEYKGHQLRSVDEADIDLSNIGELEQEETEQPEALEEDTFVVLQGRFSAILGDRIKEVRESNTLVGSPARLVSEAGNTDRHMYRINRLLDIEYELPVKTLELNPRHPLIHNLSHMISSNGDNQFVDVIIEQVFANALLQEGLHPDPASMTDRMNTIMQMATGSPADIQPIEEPSESGSSNEDSEE